MYVVPASSTYLTSNLVSSLLTLPTVDALNVHGPPSLSLPFPPFGKEPPPPPPPPPPSSMFSVPYPANSIARVNRLFKAHPYAASAGAALVLGVGLGAAGYTFTRYRAGKFGVRGRESDGMLTDAIGELL